MPNKVQRRGGLFGRLIALFLATLTISATANSGYAIIAVMRDDFVNKRKWFTEDEMNRFCEALPRYKRPRKLIFADVPRNPTGKIEKPKLRKMYGADRLIAEQNEI